MPFADNNTFARDDTFFGVCQALGEDLGFNPNYLRVAFALPLLYAPVSTIGAYFALGLIVFAIRLLVREPRLVGEAEAELVELPADRASNVDARTEAEPLAAAA